MKKKILAAGLTAVVIAGINTGLVFAQTKTEAEAGDFIPSTRIALGGMFSSWRNNLAVTEPEEDESKIEEEVQIIELEEVKAEEQAKSEAVNDDWGEFFAYTALLNRGYGYPNAWGPDRRSVLGFGSSRNYGYSYGGSSLGFGGYRRPTISDALASYKAVKEEISEIKGEDDVVEEAYNEGYIKGLEAANEGND